MNEREYNDLMRLALGSDVHWQAQTATHEGTEEIREWLLTTLRKIGRDTQAKQADLSAAKASHGPRSSTYRNALRDFSKWRGSAVRFTKMVEERLDQLPSQRSAARAVAKAERSPRPDELVKAQAHAEYVEKQKQHTFSSLVELARAVAAFESGESTVNDLAGKLDALTVPHGGNEGPGRTLRELLISVGPTWKSLESQS
jgi:uncharacterized protein YdiU (UPF0061 family)